MSSDANSSASVTPSGASSTASKSPCGADARGPPVAVIGAGPGGLAAALLLAASGIRVRIYEAQPEVGGRSRRIALGDFSFDCGPTFFMMPWVLEEIFAACGTTLTEHADLRRLDPMYRLLLGRAGAAPLTLETTQDLSLMRERIAAIEPRDGEAFDEFIALNRRKLERLTPVLRRPVRGWLDLLDLEGLRAGAMLRPWRSVADDLARRFRHPLVQRALSFQSKYLGMSPTECPELFTILPFIEYEFGIWHPIGGCNALFRAMAALAEEMGVEIRTGAPVERLEFEGRRLRAVIVNGERHEHDHAVINADATWALKSLIPAQLRGRESDAEIDSRRYSCSTFMLYLGMDGEVDLPHHTIYTSADYHGNLEDISRRGRLTEDASFYCCNASRTDPTLAPSGASSLYLLVPVPNCKPGFSQIDWRAEAPRLRERTLDQLEHLLGVDSPRRRIREERCITPLDWRAENINHGATFNLAHGMNQMLHKRPQHRMPQVDGVWFVGGGTHPGSGLPVIFLSSIITTRLLCDALGRTHPCDQPAPRRVRYPRASGQNLRQLSEDPGAPLAPVAGLHAGRA